MSDDEIDRDWKPNARPQSTMARSFSLALNDLFKIDNSIADLDAAVSEKKKAVSTQTSELEALEARLKATEERLKARGAAPTTSSSHRPRASLADDTFSSPTAKPSTETEAQRPQTGKKQDSYSTPPMPGQLPPTPGASEDGDALPPSSK